MKFQELDRDRVVERWLDVPVEFDVRPPSPVNVPDLVRRDDVDGAGVYSNDDGEWVYVDDRGRWVHVEVDENWVHFTYQGIATFSVREGEEVVVRPTEEADTEECLALLCRRTLGALLHDRGYHVLHAVTVVIDGEAILFLGESNAGKSSLAAWFAMQGYDVLADDVAAVSVDETAVRPVAPVVKLDREFADRLGVDLPKMADDILDDEVVYRTGQRRTDQVPIGGIYVLEEGEGIEIEEVSTPDAVDTLVRNTYSLVMFEGRDEQERHFRACTTIAGEVPVRRFSHPKTIDTLPDVVEAVSEDVSSG